MAEILVYTPAKVSASSCDTLSSDAAVLDHAKHLVELRSLQAQLEVERVNRPMFQVDARRVAQPLSPTESRTLAQKFRDFILRR